MPIAPPPSRSGNDAPALAAFLALHADVELPAGAIYKLESPLIITSGKRLWTNATNPATLKRMGNNNIQAVVINGIGIQIENAKLDWNMGGQWRQYNSLIALSGYGNSVGFTPQPLGDISIIGCRFIESGARVPHGNNDSWCISLTPGQNQTINNVKILSCSTDCDVQLVGNGTNDGVWNNIEVAYNYCINGWASAVGITSLHTTVSGGQTIFNNINIHHNYFRNALACGVAVGADYNVNIDQSTVQINNLAVTDNIIELADAHQYPNCIFIRPGLSSGYTARANVQRNLFIVRRSQQNTGDNGGEHTPRLVSFSANTAGSSLQFKDNVIDAHRPVTNYFSHPENVSFKFSGNSYTDGTIWTP